MRLPKVLDDLIKNKIEFLDAASEKFDRGVIRLENDLFEKLLTDIISKLKTNNGIILDTAENYQLLQSVENTYSSFNERVANYWLERFVMNIESLNILNTKFIEEAFKEQMPKRFAQVTKNIKTLTDLRFGLKGGRFVRGGWLLDNIFKYGKEDFKKQLSKAVASQIDIKDFIKLTKKLIVGSEDLGGSMEKQYKMFAYDIYQQWDRTYQTKLAEEFKLEYFIYQGGIVKDSRDFCIAHNGKIWANNETEAWKEWTPAKGLADGEFPPGYDIKQKNLYDHPSYMNYVGYEPDIDLGGYNCRHFKSYIPESLAMKLRPNLKK